MDWAHINVNDPSLHNVEGYVGLKKRMAKYGMQVYRIAKHDVHNQPEITLGLPGRDQKIQDLCDFIRNIGAAGIHYRERESLALPQQSPQATRSLQRRANIRSCRFRSIATPGRRAPRATLWL